MAQKLAELVISCCLILVPSTANACIEITGIGNDENDIYTTQQLSNVPRTVEEIMSESYDVIHTNFAPFLAFEGSIQFRFAQQGGITFWQTFAPYATSNILDYFGREDITDARKRCQPDSDSSTQVELFNLHKRVAFLYSTHFIFKLRFQDSCPDCYTTSYNILTSFGVNPNICDDSIYTDSGDDDDDGDDDINNNVYSVDNHTCWDISTPWGLAWTIAQEIETFGYYDGWNADGSYNRDYNRIPYSDWRPKRTKWSRLKNGKYVPLNDPWELGQTIKWQPLLETDFLGFLFYQEHVTPHIGYTGKSYFLRDEDICNYTSYDPQYDYNIEMYKAIDTLANLTNDSMKIEIEMFDDKTHLDYFLTQYLSGIGSNAGSMKSIVAKAIENAILYEAGIVVWKEKVNFDRVRPPSIIHALLDGQEITSYAGVSDKDGRSLGIRTFDASNWEPYIRTMPHAEYPSASACVCQAFANGMINYFGSDEIESIIGYPVSITYGINSSSYETDTPKSPITLTFSTWSEISQRCAESRVAGGMHFKESIYAGQELCKDIGNIVSDSIIKLSNGIQPDYLVDFYDTTIPHRQCYPAMMRRRSRRAY